MGTQLPLPRKMDTAPQFLAHVCCGETDGCIRIPLGTEVGFGPGNIVRWAPTPSPEKGHNPQFSAHVYCAQTAGWIKLPLGMKVGLGPCHIVLDGDPAPLPERGTASLPLFSAHVYCGHGRPS